MATKKTWSTGEELRIALEGLPPNANAAATCRAHGIHSAAFVSGGSSTANFATFGSEGACPSDAVGPTEGEG